MKHSKPIRYSDIYDMYGGSSIMTAFRVIKKYKTRNHGIRYRVQTNHLVRKWLIDEYLQVGKTNPQWWSFDGNVNMTEEMFLLTQLRWGYQE